MSSIVPALPTHIPHLALHMRQSDKDEVRASVGWDPLTALMVSLTDSSQCYVMLDRAGTPFVIFGVAPLFGQPGVGTPWLLATDAVECNRIFCLKTSLRYIDEFLKEYDTLLNHVDVRNRISIEWIKWCGFHIAGFDPEFGVERRPFFLFTKMRT